MSAVLQQMQARSALNNVTTLTICLIRYCMCFIFILNSINFIDYHDKKVDKLILQDIKGEINIGAASPKNFPMDSSVYRQSILQSKSGLGSAGIITLPPFMLLLQISTFYGLGIVFMVPSVCVCVMV